MKQKKITPLNDAKLRPIERLIMNEVLKGCLRCKYIPGDRLAEALAVSPSTIRNTLTKLDEKGYILYIRPKGKKYNLICVNNLAFERYGLIDKIKENKITKDEFFNSYCLTQQDEKVRFFSVPNKYLIEKFNKILNKD